MQTLRAACAAAMTFACAMGVALVVASPASAAWNKPWTAEDRALVIDAYEFNPIDWKELTSDKRIAGFINKASDGMPPEWNCRGKSGDAELLCKNRWWKYSVTKELYMTRRAMAKALGLEWGAYHLARPGNPRAQADHFVDFAEPTPDDLIAIDIEDNTDEWMSLADAEIFADQIFIRTGRYPVLYTNGSTAKWISDYKATYPLLSRLPLWYARYRDDITGVFPETTWPSYALWQFSSMHNCSQRKCPYRVKGAKSDIDVNVSPLDVAGLRAAWPFDRLVTPPAAPDAAPTLVASLKRKATDALASIAGGLAALSETTVPVRSGAPTAREIETARARDPLISAYGAPGGRPSHIDPLQLITETALAEHRAKAELSGLAPQNPAARLLGAGKPVKTASLGSFADLGDAMTEVAAILPEPSARVAVAPQPAARFGAEDKSRFRRWLAASEAKDRAAGLSMPAYVMSQTPRDSAGRGMRPAAVWRKAANANTPIEAGERVAEAFQATR